MAPSSGKVYIVNTSEDLKDLKGRLDGYSETEKYDDGDYSIDLVKDVQNLSIGERFIDGFYCYDYVMRNYYRGKVVHTPVTRECPFRFFKEDDELWLLVRISKDIANRVAVDLAMICNLDVREAQIYSREMNHYLKINNNTKVVLFDQLDIPGVDKSTLYGIDLVQTDLFRNLVESGSPKWVITESSLKGYTVGIGGDAGVTIYNNVNELDYISFIEAEILPLIMKKVP